MLLLTYESTVSCGNRGPDSESPATCHGACRTNSYKPEGEGVGLGLAFFKTIQSGMESSVKENAVAMEILHHGSVLPFLTQHLMILRFVSAGMKAHIMKILQFSYWRYTFSDYSVPVHNSINNNNYS